MPPTYTCKDVMDRDTGGMLDSVWSVAGVVAYYIVGRRNSHHDRSHHHDP